MRPKSACAECRARRKRCIRPQQGTSCDYCTARNLLCTVTQGTELREHGYEPIVPQRQHSLTHTSNELPPTDLCEELIDLYFRYIHVCFHVLFHQPTFLGAFKSGSLPKVLLLAVMGMSARFSEHKSLADVSPRDRGRPFTREAERLLNLHDISLITIQACLLLGASAVVEGEGATESVYFSIACRMALLLDLPNARACTCIEQELNYRVWWAVYETDTWSSTGVRLPKMMPLRDVPLPMAEISFVGLSTTAPPREWPRGNSSPILDVPQDSLIAHSVTVNIILSKVDDVNSQAVTGKLQGTELIEAVEKVSHELDRWARGLPPEMADTQENLRYWTKEGFGNIFVVLHMNYYYICLLLFYQFLHDGPTSHHLKSQYALKCRHHATRVCELIHRASEYPGAELRNTIVGHVLAIASTVQLHIFLFSGDEAAVNRARRLLERNFEILMCLREYWPCIDISFARFQAFHRACERSLDDSLFRLDQWMLKFMLEFAAPLTDRLVEMGMDSPQLPWPLVSTETEHMHAE